MRGAEKWESNVGEVAEEEGREAAGATVILAITVRGEDREVGREGRPWAGACREEEGSNHLVSPVPRRRRTVSSPVSRTCIVPFLERALRGSEDDGVRRTYNPLSVW